MFTANCQPILIGSLPLVHHEEAMQLILDHKGAIPAPVKHGLPAAPVALEHADLGRAERKGIGRRMQIGGMHLHMRHLRVRRHQSGETR